MKPLKNLLTILLILLPLSAYAWGVVPTSGGVAAPAGGGGDEPTALYTSATSVWRFNNAATDTKTAHDLTLSGNPTYGTTTPPEGTHYLDCDGTGDYATVADHADFDLGNRDWSISLRFNIDALDSDGLFGKWSDGNGVWVYEYYDTDHYILRLANDASWSTEYFTLSTTISADTWYHMVLTYDASETQYTLWLSTTSFGNVVNGTTFDNTSHPADNAGVFRIGYGGYTSSDIDGLFDEAVWFGGTELTATDAQELYDHPGSW